MFDYDGTLAPLAPEPSLAHLPPGTRSLLGSLSAVSRVHVGVISGRPLLDLRRMVGLPGLSYAGTGGLEMEIHGVRLTDPAEESHRALIGGIAGGLASVAASHRGAWVEDKGSALTLHYRHVSPEGVSPLLGRANALLRGHEARVRVLQGPMAWEVSPARAWDKGTALRAITEASGPGAIPLYAGDSANDAPALDAAVALGGLAFAVGDDAPPAPHRLGGPDDVVALLMSLAAGIGPTP